ncbi:hypothetical protein F1C16_22010 (plasmid) [Hymenobacter sp. NBH84]|uniref:hypothetical protein n=1 Tax=Hymenobacter sp. NBH84 TaxID=2596915 RepID=UPI001628EEDA|nr:hypothetical protein [Hymenobacter sp. NBH84]QNE42302.1 hypothetical protein F1C16_22010 [Hymenobacter sp. NBH84]
MENLRNIPGVQMAPSFNFTGVRAQLAQCDLVVHPAQGWAIATEPPEARVTGFNECAENLAAKICIEYDIAPTALVLVAHYVYAGNEYYFLYHFVHGDHDIFGGITFIGAHRKLLDAGQVAQLLQHLLAGGQPGPEMIAIQNPVQPLRRRTRLSL